MLTTKCTPARTDWKSLQKDADERSSSQALMDASHTLQHFQFGALALRPEHELFQNKVRTYLCQNLQVHGRLPIIIQIFCVAGSARFLQSQLLLSHSSVQGNRPSQRSQDSDFPPVGVSPDTISEAELLPVFGVGSQALVIPRLSVIPQNSKHPPVRANVAASQFGEPVVEPAPAENSGRDTFVEAASISAKLSPRMQLTIPTGPFQLGSLKQLSTSLTSCQAETTFKSF